MKILVKELRLPPTENPVVEIPLLAIKRISPVVPKKNILSASLFKRSVDARKRDNVTFLCSALIEIDCNVSAEKLAKVNASVFSDAPSLDSVEPGSTKMESRPLIVGFGPCGMFCALLLAEKGYRPLIIERGGSVAERRMSVEHFYATGNLNTESNIQFGAGGAGTFSDGKLVTRINDANCRYILEKMHEFGAPEDVLTCAKPHVGTDVLYKIVDNIADRITSLGGEIRYNTRLDDIVTRNGKIVSAVTSGGEIPCDVMILCTGHSARDTFTMLKKREVQLHSKPFSVGVRIEHLREDIDRAMYGDFAGLPYLGHAEYQLSHRRSDGTGVYTFCMCPGGEVVAAASEEGGVVVNGMSASARDGVNSNSAVAVSVSCEMAEAMGGGIEFQRRLERAAYEAGRNSSKAYAAPCQRFDDFVVSKVGGKPGKIKPSYMGGNVVMTDVGAVFPKYIRDSLAEGILAMDKKLGTPGVFASGDAILTGAETRTSSPLRIPRGGDMTALGFDNLYPCGEGAGYAGGITSAAADGISCAVAIVSKYAPF